MASDPTERPSTPAERSNDAVEEPDIHWMDACDQPEVERIWLSTQAHEWRALALVPTSPDASVLQLAYAVSWLSLRLRGEAIGVTDLRDAALETLGLRVETVREQIRHGRRVILVLRPCSESVATVPLVHLADAAILCVSLGASRLVDTHRAIAQIGRERFLGSVIIHPTHGPTSGFPVEPSHRLRA